MTHDWEEMASVVARKLVEDGQTRILQRIYEGVTSDWDLDVADAKSSKDHSLIHLVWRKFPRNRHTTEERRLTAVFTQTEEGSKSLDRQAIEEVCSKILDQQAIERYSGSDLGKLFEAENNTSFSDAGSSSDFYSSGSAGRERTSYDYSPEDTSFIPPPKRRSGKKLLFIDKKFNPELFNRFNCLEEVPTTSTQEDDSSKLRRKPENVDTLGETVRKSPSIDKFHKRTTSPKVKSPPELSYETQLRQLKASINTNNKPLPENVLFDMPTTSSSGIPGVGVSPPPIPSVSAIVSTPEVMFAPDQASSSLSKLRRKGVVKWFDSSKMSYGFITMDGKVVFFHVNNVRNEGNYAPKPGDEVTFILDEYDRGVIDVKRLTCMDVYNAKMDPYLFTGAAANHKP